MRQRHRIQPYLSLDLHKQLRRYCGKAGCTETATVEAALKDYFERDTRDGAQIIRRLDRMLRASNRRQRQLDIIGEMLATFVKVWFAHTPRMAESEKAAAEQSAHTRYQKFIQYVRELLSRGGGLAFDIGIDDSVADDDENDPAIRGVGREKP